MDQTPNQGPAAGPEQPEVQKVPTQALPSGDVSSQDKLMAALSYFPLFLVLIFLFSHFQNKKNHPFVTHHMNQALAVLIVSLIGTVISYLPVIGVFAFLVNLFALVLMVWGIINAVQGTWKKLPLFGDLKVFD